MIGALVARKALAGAFEALNRHDLPGFMSGWRDDGVFEYPGDIPESGTFKGRSAVEGWFRRFFDQFPAIRFDVRDMCVRNIFDLTGTNVVAVHWNIQLTNREGRVGRNSGVTVVSIERGKVVHVRDFIFDVGADFRRNWSSQESVDAAIRNRVAQYEAAYNAGDADHLAAIYAADGTHTYAVGVRHHGRVEIANGLKEQFAGPMKGTHLTLTPLHIRAVSPDVAVEEASFSLSGLKDASGAVMPPVGGLCLAVYQRQGNEWFAAAVQCMAPPPAPESR